MIPVQTLPPDCERRVQSAAVLFTRFARAGAFPEVKDSTAAAVSIVGGVCQVVLQDAPADQATLGVLGRMLLTVPGEWDDIDVRGTPAQRPERAVDPLLSSMAVVPSLRQPLCVKAEIDPGLGWYCLELTRHAGWSQKDVVVLQDVADLWLAVCRHGGLSEVNSSCEVTPGNVGMDPPQVGADFWAAQIGATDVHLGAISALVNMLDHLSRTLVRLDAISIT